MDSVQLVELASSSSLMDLRVLALVPASTTKTHPITNARLVTPTALNALALLILSARAVSPISTPSPPPSATQSATQASTKSHPTTPAQPAMLTARPALALQTLSAPPALQLL